MYFDNFLIFFNFWNNSFVYNILFKNLFVWFKVEFIFYFVFEFIY